MDLLTLWTSSLLRFYTLYHDPENYKFTLNFELMNLWEELKVISKSEDMT